MNRDRTAGVSGLASGLRRRLVVLLLVPLALLALANAWIDYRSADSASVQQDQRLASLLPLVADAIIGDGPRAESPPIILLPPALQEFLARPASAFAVTDADGRLLRGDPWLAGLPPASAEPEFHSEENGGRVWRIVRQRQQTVIGEVIVALADGSSPQQQWLRGIVVKVLLPNLVLILAAAFAVGWAVERALRPLLALREAVERRSPRDLSPLDTAASPEEVRPLVQSLNRLFALVEAQAESQRRFVADAAHQLRTPLAGLQAQVEAWVQAGRKVAPGETLALPLDQLERLRGATRRTSQLANQLLALSRADSRTMQAEPEQAVDLKALCEDLLALHLDAATARSIDLGLDAAPVTASGHEWLLRELLSNLVDNAVKYGAPGGAVTIRCGTREGTSFLEVEDDGPGIPEADRARVRERFYRVPGTQGEGNGLGLAIAEEIARVHGATLGISPGAQGRGLRVGLALRP